MGRGADADAASAGACRTASGRGTRLHRGAGAAGAAVARELGDGLFVTLMIPEFAKEFSSVSYLFWGTVFDDGEDVASDRVRAAGGPGWALAYHAAYEFGAPLADLPGGVEWQVEVERTPP